MVIHNDPIFYAIVNSADVSSVDFSQLLGTINGVRYSLNGNKAILKWRGTSVPPTISSLQGILGPYTTEQIREIMNKPEWESVN